MYFILDNGQSYSDHALYFYRLNLDDVQLGIQIVETAFSIGGYSSEGRVIATADQIEWRDGNDTCDLFTGIPYSMLEWLEKFEHLARKTPAETLIESLKEVQKTNEWIRRDKKLAQERENTVNRIRARLVELGKLPGPGTVPNPVSDVDLDEIDSSRFSK